MHLFPVQAIRSDMPSFHRAAVFLNDRLNHLSRRRLLHEIAGQTVIGEQTFDLGQQPLIAGANFVCLRQTSMAKVKKHARSLLRAARRVESARSPMKKDRIPSGFGPAMVINM